MVWDADLLKADLECSGKELRGKPVDIREGGEKEDTFLFSGKTSFLTITNTQQ